MITQTHIGGITVAPSAGLGLLANYDRQCAQDGEARARATLLDALAQAPEHDWLDCAQRLVLQGRVELATTLLVAAHVRHPRCAEVAVALAGLYRQVRRDDRAESVLRTALQHQPANAAAALLLARLLKDAGRMRAVALTLKEPFQCVALPVDLVIQALELLDDCDRKADAAQIAEAQIAAGRNDPRIHAYAATFAIQLGQFDTARKHYLYAYAHSADALEWNVPYGLSQAQRYPDAGDADFALFHECLSREMSDKARTTLLFALGKAYDDVADPARAAGYFRQANELAHSRSSWSRKLWRRSIEARLHSRPLAARDARADSTPIFVVGVPRSGTTLVAELLARYPQVCNRGELRWLWTVSQRLPATGSPDTALLDALAAQYEAQLHQDDAGQARWFIDKQPLNLLHVDLILALWPHARIIHCQRNARDTALSLWTQFFLEDTHAYAYDFGDIAVVAQGCSRLMAHWKQIHARSIYTLRYEELTAAPAAEIGALAAWLGLPNVGLPDGTAVVTPLRGDAINTASLWQARQPVYTRSVGRWRTYAAYVPELLKLPQDD